MTTGYLEDVETRIDIDALIDHLNDEIKKHASMKAYAESLGISQQYLVSILKKTKEPGLKFWRVFGYEKVSLFMK